ncbi:MAG: hypothetical protein SGPRY_007747, partial [Prymnesium sp.]
VLALPTPPTAPAGASIPFQVNVLALDTDMLVLSNPYPLLHSPPLLNYTLILPAESSRVNLGVMYVRGSLCEARGGTASVFWDVVRRLRLFVEGNDSRLLRDRHGKLSLQVSKGEGR